MIGQRPDPEVIDRCLGVLGRQTGNLSRIVDDLLDVARITRGKISLSRERVDLRGVAERCVRDADGARHVVDLELPAEPVPVIGDAVRLEQIATNLVANALEYTPPGGQISVRVGSSPGTAWLAVADTGIGMDAEMCERAFDVFVQGKQSIDRARGGLGLGLAVVRQLAALHGGTVTAHSEGAGKGCRFVVELPLAPPESTAAPPAGAAAPARSGGVRIIVIEDHDEVRQTLCDALATLDHQVEGASDGPAGLALVLETLPDVALVDIGLPGLDGYEIARQIRTRCNGASPHLVAMTGYGQPEDRARAEAAGFDVHLVKPVSLTQLQQILAAVTPRRPA
jgi:CheY-like chemotaxis protein/two-component sensor histidine kinase